MPLEQRRAAGADRTATYDGGSAARNTVTLAALAGVFDAVVLRLGLKRCKRSYGGGPDGRPTMTLRAVSPAVWKVRPPHW